MELYVDRVQFMTDFERTVCIAMGLCFPVHVDVLVEDCSNPSANALELQQSCTKPSM